MGEANLLCVGDLICLFCEATEGYVTCWQTSASYRQLYIHNRQNRDKPDNIHNPHMLVFQVVLPNRYKLNKKYRKLAEAFVRDPDNNDIRNALAEAKICADAETGDNAEEHQRQLGRRLNYGDVVQLKHRFTGKFVHISTDQTSSKDKNNLKVYMDESNAKNAQLRILSNYRVKAEKQPIQFYDQIVFESIKSQGQFFHASSPFQIDRCHFGSEVNLGVDMTGFTVVKYFRPKIEKEPFLLGGSVVQLFHKVLQGYLVAEGLFDDELTEDVHLSVRKEDPLIPHSMEPPTSGITYWQIVDESTATYGDVLRWEHQVQFRHLTTGLYLCINVENEVCLRASSTDLYTVFRLHPMAKDTDEIQFESFARVEHVVSGCWLHAERDVAYERRQIQNDTSDNASVAGISWSEAPLRKIASSDEKLFPDAFAIRRVQQSDVNNFYFAAGCAPFIENLLDDLSQDVTLTPNSSQLVCSALKELSQFMIVAGSPLKIRQKLLRNLRIVDLLVKVLQCNAEGRPDQEELLNIFRATFDVIHCYLMGRSRKNKLYFLRYLDFFQNRFQSKRRLGLKVAQMMVELIRGNQKTVDRITVDQIRVFADQFRSSKSYYYLDLLSVVCVCEDVAIPDNQTYIAQNVLHDDPAGLYHTENGDRLGLDPGVIYISVDGRQNWIELKNFIDKMYPGYDAERVQFYQHQLEFFHNLCFGRNEFVIRLVTEEMKYFTWENLFLCLQNETLSDVLRAKYCDLMIGLYIDVGKQIAMADINSQCFVYDNVENEDLSSERSHQESTSGSQLQQIIPALKHWIENFLDDIQGVVASAIGRNVLIEQVLRLVHCLVNFGYYDAGNEMSQLHAPLMKILDGHRDLPFDPHTARLNTFDAKKMLFQFKRTKFEISAESNAVVNAKYRGLEVLDLILYYQFKLQYHSFIKTFKQADRSYMMRASGLLAPHTLQELLTDTFRPFDTHKKAMKAQKKMTAALNELFTNTTVFDTNEFTRIILDLTHYKHEKIVTKSLELIDKFFSTRIDVFKSSIHAQVLLTPDSLRVHEDLLSTLPVLRRVAKAKMTDEHADTIQRILQKLTDFCSPMFDVDEAHIVNQKILVSHNLLTILFDLLSSRKIDVNLMDQYQGLHDVFIAAVQLLRALARKNNIVQRQLFDHFETLLHVQGIERDIALLLRDAFIDNQATCLNVQSRHVERIVALVCEHREQVPEYLELLHSIVKISGPEISLRRNQTFVMKHIMRSFTRIAPHFNESQDYRMDVLTGNQGTNSQQYLSCLVGLLAACAEGENRLAHSMCKTILSVDEILDVLNLPQVDNNIKKPFLVYLVSIFIASPFQNAEIGTANIGHNQNMWSYLPKLCADIEMTAKFLRDNMPQLANLLKTPLAYGKPINRDDRRALVHANLHYILDAALPFLSTFVARFYVADHDTYPDEPAVIDTLANALLSLSELVKPHLIKGRHMKSLLNTTAIVLMSSTLDRAMLNSYVDDFKALDFIQLQENEGKKLYQQYYTDELALNKRFSQFVINSSLLYGGHNTVASQLQIHKNWAKKREYTQIMSREALPLGAYFQDYVKSFVLSGKSKVNQQLALLVNVIRQLGFPSGHLAQKNEAARLSQETVNIRCLQMLRAIIHNEIVKLPKKWKDDLDDNQILKRIASIQNCLMEMNIFRSIMPLTDSRNEDIVRETLSLTSCLLFNANRAVQDAMLEYFKSIREETFFTCLKNSMQTSVSAYKESRQVAIQSKAKVNELEILAKRKRQVVVLKEIRLAQRGINRYEQVIQQDKARTTEVFTSMSFEELQQTAIRNQMNQTKKKSKKVPSTEPAKKRKPAKTDRAEVDEKANLSGSRSKLLANGDDGLLVEDGMELKSLKSVKTDKSKETSVVGTLVTIGDNMSRVTVQTSELDKPQGDMGENDDDDDARETISAGPGNLILVLRILAEMCDGQNTGLQDYIRDQPDNITTIKVVTETVAILDTLYANITSDNISIILQIFATLNEMASGNQKTRTELVECKIVDYVNNILRTPNFPGCSDEEIVELKQSMASLIQSMIEENGAAELVVAKSVKDQLDHDTVCKLITHCYRTHQGAKPSLKDLQQRKGECGPLNTLRVMGRFVKKTCTFLVHKVHADEKAKLMVALKDLGFSYFLIMHRFCDIDPELQKVHFESGEKNTEMKQRKPDPREIEKKMAFQYYKDRISSIEIVKDGCIQKVNFRIRDKNLIREEIKETLKWNVDRTSPSEKLRDFHLWFKDIQAEIRYQQKVLSFFLMAAITRRWTLWCVLCMLLSLIINIFMLITWEPQLSLSDLQTINPGDVLPPAMYNATPKVPDKQFWDLFIYTAGAIHNSFALLALIGYFMANHPQLPSLKGLFQSIKNFFTGQTNSKLKQMTSGEEEVKSKIAVEVLSFKTFYYVAFLAISLLGTFYNGYFFSFHLLEIINVNTLLGGVIQSVTLNGQSLIWVAILGVVIFYIYTLSAFALLRDIFDPANRAYCASLVQCFVSVLRYGLIGDYDGAFVRHENAPGDTFINFLLLAIFKMTFFIVITTIGLNIIFGIIVDTFSELRDKKWTAEADMRDCCFICGISSYKFENRSYGFLLHVNYEHNMWSYLYFMLHLSNTAPSDFTAIELYVYNQMQAENLDFFPMNRALSLDIEEEDETDTKIDELVARVDMLVQKQREQEAEKRHKEVRRQQQRWQETHLRTLAIPPRRHAARAHRRMSSIGESSESPI